MGEVNFAAFAQLNWLVVGEPLLFGHRRPEQNLTLNGQAELDSTQLSKTHHD